MNSATKQKMTTDGDFTDELQPGTTLLQGQYVIECFLNSGGFGMTYIARDSLERIVVIKECFPATFCTRSVNTVRARSQTHQKDFTSIVRLFLQEARQLAKLDHPNIVGVHQVFEDNETAYMALDFIDGLDMLDMIEANTQKISAKELRVIVLKLLDAVGFMHEQDILHRDISPDNILLDQSGNPVLIDFGAAREKASKASRALSALLVVKDGYSPQEFYFVGSEQGPYSDLYALAASFFHLIDGSAPPHSQSRLAAVAEQKPDPYLPLENRVAGYDRGFLAAIDKALNLFPKDRFQSAAEWVVAIDRNSRVEHELVVAKQDMEIDKSISILVSETNPAVHAAIEQSKNVVETKAPTAAPVSKLRAKFANIARELALDVFDDDDEDEDDAVIDAADSGEGEHGVTDRGGEDFGEDFGEVHDEVYDDYIEGHMEDYDDYIDEEFFIEADANVEDEPGIEFRQVDEFSDHGAADQEDAVHDPIIHPYRPLFQRLMSKRLSWRIWGFRKENTKNLGKAEL